MTRPLLLDLYCCSGGAAMGYHRAGFDVVGVDIVPRPRYPFPFIQANALDVLSYMLHTGGEFSWNFKPGMIKLIRPVVVHTSPPCQKDNPLMKGTHGNRPNPHKSWTAETRESLDQLGLPYVIEQPAGSGAIREDLKLCMDMFPVDPPRVFRHRLFELSGFTVPQPIHTKHVGRVRGWRHSIRYEGDYIAAYGHGGGKAEVPEMQHAMGIDWTDVREELMEAIPPAYTEFIGRHLITQL
jgi:hypothetical protein